MFIESEVAKTPSEVKWSEKLLSCVQFFATPWPAAHQAPLFMGILQARTLEWVAFPFSRGSSQPKDQTQVSCTAGRFFTDWTTREAQTNYDLQQFVKVYLYEQKSISFSPDLIPPEFWNPQTTIVHSPKPCKLKWGNNINFREITTIAHGRSLCLLLCGHSERLPETFKLKTKNIFQISTACTLSIWRGFKLDI